MSDKDTPNRIALQFDVSLDDEVALQILRATAKALQMRKAQGYGDHNGAMRNEDKGRHLNTATYDDSHGGPVLYFP